MKAWNERLAEAKPNEDGDLFYKGDLIGPSKVGAEADALFWEAKKLEEQAKELLEKRRLLVQGCKHYFDNGRNATQGTMFIDFCVICGR